jgi:molecular chaperone DnaK
MGQAMYAQAQQTPREEPAAEHTTAAEEEGVVDAEIVDDEKETRGGAA